MRGLRKQMGNAVWLVAMIATGLIVGSYLLAHERIAWPSWVPGLGRDYFYVNAKFTTSAGVLPGQGNAVTIAGVKVGEISGEKVQDGQAVLKLRLDAKYGHVHPDATLLLRPKTALKDMVAEMDPGTKGPELKDGATLGVSSTEPDVNLDEILAGLDGDTRAALVSLVQNGGEALDGEGGKELSATFKRFEPLSRDAAKASRLVAQRRVKLRTLMGNLSLLAQELGDRDRELGEFVNSSAAVFRHFDNQNQALGETLSLLPGTLQKTNVGVGKLNNLGRSLNRGLRDLQPTADALGPALKATQPFLKQTTPVIRDSLRPFSVEAKPTVAKLVPAATHLGKATPNLDTLTKMLNDLLAELAHDPPGDGVHGNSYLYYVPWANHNSNSVMAAQDGIGPARHSLILVNCGGLSFFDTLTRQGSTSNPFLTTLTKLLNEPKHDEVCAKGEGS
jgi:phospholipid/cholesterol/gamma-HCH transport system substrate-binding protein